MSKITTVVEKITPDIAEEWLEFNTSNYRPPRDRRIETYARDMAAGNWRLSNDAITFSDAGLLLNGQHRLKAVVLSGATIEAVIVRGLPADSADIMDQGAARRIADVLRRRGESYPHVLGAVARRIVLWEAGFIIHHAALAPTEHEMADAIERHPDLRIFCEYGQTHRGDMKTVIPASQMAFARWVLNQCGPQESLLFLNRFSDGIELEEGAPVLALRRRLRKEKDAAGIYVNPAMNLALIVWAWNAYCQKRSMRNMVLNPDALTDENFPMPVLAAQPYKSLNRSL